MSDPDYVELEADFGEVMGILRQGRLESPTETPDLGVWNAIAAGLNSEVPDEEFEQEPIAMPPAPFEAQQSDVVSLDSRRTMGRRIAVITGIAAAILLVAVPLSLALGGESSQRAELAAMGGFGGTGEAELSGRTLTIDLEGLTSLDDGSAYELWLLDVEGEEVQGLHSLGMAQADGTFTVPEDVDLTEFTVVDVSIEPDDGNPDHSGASVLRGGLQET